MTSRTCGSARPLRTGRGRRGDEVAQKQVRATTQKATVTKPAKATTVAAEVKKLKHGEKMKGMKGYG